MKNFLKIFFMFPRHFPRFKKNSGGIYDFAILKVLFLKRAMLSVL